MMRKFLIWFTLTVFSFRALAVDLDSDPMDYICPEDVSVPAEYRGYEAAAGGVAALIALGLGLLTKGRGGGAVFSIVESNMEMGGMDIVEAVRNASRIESGTEIITVNRTAGGTRTFTVQAVREAETLAINRTGAGRFVRMFRMEGNTYTTAATQEEWIAYTSQLEARARVAENEPLQTWREANPDRQVSMPATDTRSLPATIRVTRVGGGTRSFRFDAVREAETVVVDRHANGTFTRTFRLDGNLYATPATEEEWQLYECEVAANEEAARMRAEYQWETEYEQAGEGYVEPPQINREAYLGPLNGKKVIAHIRTATQFMPVEDCEVVAENVLRWGAPDDVEWYFMARDETWYSVRIVRKTEEVFVHVVLGPLQNELGREVNYYVIRTQGLVDFILSHR